MLNDGGMPLPSGALLRSESSPSLDWLTADASLSFALPDVAKDATFTVPQEWQARIFDIPPPQLVRRWASLAGSCCALVHCENVKR